MFIYTNLYKFIVHKMINYTIKLISAILKLRLKYIVDNDIQLWCKTVDT